MSSYEFNSIVTGNVSYLQPFAFSLTKDTEAAKDLIQDTLFKALINKSKYAPGTNIRAWLYTIMRNIFINNYRRQKRQSTVIDTTENGYLIDSSISITNNAGLSMINTKEIHKAIDSLPQTFKIPFLLHFEGYKYFEISGMLKEPLGTIKSRIHFARKLLKEELAIN